MFSSMATLRRWYCSWLLPPPPASAAWSLASAASSVPSDSPAPTSSVHLQIRHGIHMSPAHNCTHCKHAGIAITARHDFSLSLFPPPPPPKQSGIHTQLTGRSPLTARHRAAMHPTPPTFPTR